MPPAVRISDATTGHGCFPPPIISAQISPPSNQVLINNLPVAREGDQVEIHTCGNSFHNSTIDSGSLSVKVGGKSVARIADLTSCGDVITTGSGNVMVGR